MTGEIIEELHMQIWCEISLPDGGRIVDVWPIDEMHWESEEACNRNVYRLDASNQVVWKVKREGEFDIDWEQSHKYAKFLSRGTDWYEDPFAHMSTTFFRKNIVHKNSGDEVEYLPQKFYEPGMILPLSTYERRYELDPETGVATFNGEHIK